METGKLVKAKNSEVDAHQVSFITLAIGNIHHEWANTGRNQGRINLGLGNADVGAAGALAFDIGRQGVSRSRYDDLSSIAILPDGGKTDLEYIGPISQGIAYGCGVDTVAKSPVQQQSAIGSLSEVGPRQAGQVISTGVVILQDGGVPLDKESHGQDVRKI